MTRRAAIPIALRRRDPSGLVLGRGRLRPTPPFDFERSLAFIGGFSPAEGEQTTDDGVLTGALRQDGHTVCFRVRSTGTVDQPRLAFTLLSKEQLPRTTRAAVRERIGCYLSVTDDLRPFYDLAHADPRLRSRIEALEGLHQVRFPSPFECACWSVLSRRTSHSQALATKRALTEEFGDEIDVDGRTYPAFPEATDMIRARETRLRKVVRNAGRARYLRALTEAFADVDESWLRDGDVEDVSSWLRSIDGIGEWSASFILFRGLGRGHSMPMTEPLLQAARAVYGERRSEEQIQRIADGYGSWAGYWALYLRASPDTPAARGHDS